MKSAILLFAGIHGFLVVALGAFGAHALENILDAGAVSIYETAVQYHMFHIVGLVALGFVDSSATAIACRWALWLFNLGIVLFCGSLYLMALSGVNWLGMITPLGGVLFLAAWGLLAVMAIKNRRAQ